MTYLTLLFCLFGAVFSAPTCDQISTMRTALQNAAQDQDGLLPLYLRLGNTFVMQFVFEKPHNQHLFLVFNDTFDISIDLNFYLVIKCFE